jgi:hypothetical protein
MVIPGSNNTSVQTGALAGAVVVIALWIIGALLPAGTETPAEIGAAATVLVTALVQRFTAS